MFIVYIYICVYFVPKNMLKSRHRLVVVELCAQRTLSPYFIFIPMGILVLNFARSSGAYPYHKV